MDQKTDNKKSRDFFSRVRKYVIQLLLVISFLIGLVFLFVGLTPSSGSISSTDEMIHEVSKGLGEAFIIATIIGFIYDYHMREIKEEKDKELITEQVDKVIKEIPKTLMLDKKVREELIKELSSGDKFNENLSIILKGKFGDDGGKISEIISNQVFKYEPVASTTKHEVFLKPPSDKKSFYDIVIEGSYFRASRDISEHTMFKFVGTSNIETWKELMKDESIVQVWYLGNINGKIDENWFNATHCYISVGEKKIDMKKNRYEKDSSLYYEYSIDKKYLNDLRNEEPIKVVYELTTKLPINWSHYEYITNFLQRGLNVSFNDDTNGYITNIRVLGFLLSGGNLHISDDDKTPGHREISCDGWVLPKSGVVFVWQNKKNTET